MNKTRISWLAGAWDGEGSIGMTKYEGKWFDKKRSSFRREFKYKPFIAIVNTNEAFISEVIKILDHHGIIFNISEKAENTALGHRKCYNLITFDIFKIKATLELLLPYLVSKKPQAELLLRYADDRISKRKDNPSGKSTPHFTDADKMQAEDILKALKDLNARGKKNESPETTRQTP